MSSRLSQAVRGFRRLRNAASGAGELRRARDFFRPDRLDFALVSPLASARPIAGVLGVDAECLPGGAGS